MEMQGRIDEGIDWLESREADWAPDNGFAFHNFWHLALFYLDRQRYDDGARPSTTARIHPSRPDRRCSSSTPPRCSGGSLRGGRPRRAAPGPVADNWAARLDAERGFYAFNDMHAMMAFTMAGRETEAARLMEDMRVDGASTARASTCMMTRDVGLPRRAGRIRAFGRGRHAEADRPARAGARPRAPLRRQPRPARRHSRSR